MNAPRFAHFTWRNPSSVWFVFVPWLIAIILYALDLTIFSEAPVVGVLLALLPPLLPMALVLVLARIVKYLTSTRKARSIRHTWAIVDLDNAYRLNNALLRVFWAILIVEVLYFGEIPLISMAMGSDITHFDFGIPGVHGLLYAIGAAVATISYSLYLLTRQRRYLLQVASVLIVFVLLVTRKMFLVVGLQMLIVYVGLNGWRRIGRIGLYTLAAIWIFGLVGDIRTGREEFLALAGLKVDYPPWLPSGFIWVYIYAITPIANYVNMLQLLPPQFDPVDLVSWAIPPRILLDLFGIEIMGGFQNDWQVSGAFNVATGFANVYPTLGGQMGVVIFSILSAALIVYFSRIKSLYHRLSLATIYTCSVLMVFNNNLMSLNVVFQLVIYMFCARVSRKRSRALDSHSISSDPCRRTST